MYTQHHIQYRSRLYATNVIPLFYEDVDRRAVSLQQRKFL